MWRAAAAPPLPYAAVRARRREADARAAGAAAEAAAIAAVLELVLPGGTRLPSDQRPGGHLFVTWAGTAAPCRLRWHVDDEDGLLLVWRGWKKVALAPPGVKLPTDFPFARRGAPPAPWHVVALGPGDGLYIPKGWRHAVVSGPGTWALAVDLEAC